MKRKKPENIMSLSGHLVVTNMVKLVRVVQ
jgi:hypothetical protein